MQNKIIIWFVNIIILVLVTNAVRILLTKNKNMFHWFLIIYVGLIEPVFLLSKKGGYPPNPRLYTLPSTLYAKLPTLYALR